MINQTQKWFQKLLLCVLIIGSTPAQAQITPDNTLSSESSRITPNSLINGANADLINGGAQRGINLFHSFSEFNIKDGLSAVNARDRISLDGNSSNQNGTGIYSTVDSKAVGNAGNIKLTTGSLSLNNGGQLSTVTIGNGKAGNISVDARDRITLEGTNTNGRVSGIYSSAESGSVGKGGDVEIKSGLISLSDSKISVNSAGVGNAGNTTVKAGILTLNNGASISAQTASSEGGNIDLQLSDYLLMRRGSIISTSAGTALSGGNGGNININAPFIVAVPKENSDISANAFSGNGGNVNIRAQSIIGIEARPQVTDTSDITASSESGIQGQVSIQQPEIQPTQGIFELPTRLTDVSNQIGQLCPRGELAFRRPLSKFVVTGRGSLPPNPLQPLPGKIGVRPLASLDGDNSTKVSPTPNSLLPTPSIIEAQGFMKTADGGIALVANVPVSTPSASTTTAACVKPSEK